MNKALILAAALLIAASLSFARGGREAAVNAAYHLGLYDKAAIEQEIFGSIDKYNKVSATFYNTGGETAGLNEIPAAKLLKRRLFKDINMLKRDGLLMVFDKDSVTKGRVIVRNRFEAEAETREVWAIALQHVKTRKPVFNVKAVVVKCRYHLFLQDGRWLVEDVDVSPGTDVSMQEAADRAAGRK